MHAGRDLAERMDHRAVLVGAVYKLDVADDSRLLQRDAGYIRGCDVAHAGGGD